jgi:hypothetical protein
MKKGGEKGEQKFKLLAISLITAAILVVTITGVALADDSVGVNSEEGTYCGQGWGGYHGHEEQFAPIL